MANARLAHLRDEFTSLRDGCQYLDDLAGAAKRDLTDDERGKYDAACTRMEAIEGDITETLARMERFDKVAAVTATISDSAPSPAPRHESPALTRSRLVTYDPARASVPHVRSAQDVTDLGNYAFAIAKAKHGLIGHDEANEILGRFGATMDERTLLTRAIDPGTSADGISPTTIEGDLIKFVDANRYAVNRSRKLPMPDNKSQTFKRPRVSQRTTVATQAAERDVLSSQRLKTAGDDVTKHTHGGVLSLTEQEVDWTEPSLLGLSLEDLAESYAIDTDNTFCDALEAAFTASVQTVVSLTAASDVFIAALAKSAAACYGTSKKLPDTLFVSVDRWAYLAGLTDGEGRPIFPIVGAFNTAGQNLQGVASFTGFNIMGLDVIVDPNFSNNIWATAVSSLCETYEQNKGLLSINVPSTLETQYAYRGYFATNVYTQGVNALEAA